MIDINPRVDDNIVLSLNLRDAGVELKSRGPCWTGFDENMGIIACGGVARICPGVGEAWLVASGLVHRNKLYFHRFCRAQLITACTALYLHRVQAVVQVKHRFGHRWIKSLGFQAEGVLRRYALDGGDSIIYSRLPREVG
tara:strand:- start:1180 stop:1599 length:420 start_codon:yes stop_codon:yes gene_type:complete